ncbi:MAG: multicopper oxidase domain-containing protein, partial [Cyanobium sp.]
MTASSGEIPQDLRGRFFSEYYVYDNGPGDDDPTIGVIDYTTYFGAGPYRIPGLGDYIRNVLGLPFPTGTQDLLYSFEDLPNQNKSSYSPVYLYSFGHFNELTNSIDAVSPGAMIQLNPGQKLTLRTKLLIDIDKYPLVNTSGVAFMEGGGAGSTNMHFHGTNSSPKGYGDNVDIESRTDFVNSIKLPESHHEGLAWWHPHFHSSANAQVYGGAFGNLQIGDSLNNIPEFANAKRNFIGIKNYNVTYNQQTQRFEVRSSQFTPEDTARNINLINGEYKPVRDGFQTGEWNSFSFINYASNSYYNIKIVKTLGNVDFNINDKSTWGDFVDLYIYGKDGYQSSVITQANTGINNTILSGLQLEDPVGNMVTNLPNPPSENNLFLSPARRYETLAYFEDPGDYKIISQAWTGAGLRAGGWIWNNIDLGTIRVGGDVAPPPTLLPSDVTPTLPYPSIGLDLRTFEPLRERRITWTSDSFVEGPNRYKKINGVVFDTSKTLMSGLPNRYAGYSTPFLTNDNVLPYGPAQISQLDTLEYWNHENWSAEQHPFHPHQNHFQIIDSKSGPTDRFPVISAQDEIQDTPVARQVIQLFIAYLGRLPTYQELSTELNEENTITTNSTLASPGKKKSKKKGSAANPPPSSRLATKLSTSDAYRDEFERFYTIQDKTKNPFTQVADGAFYTLTRDNIYNPLTSNVLGRRLMKIGLNKFPLDLLVRLQSGKLGQSYKARLNNLATAGLYAINKVATNPSGTFVTTGTALLRVLNQQINQNPASVTRLYPIIDQLVGFDPNNYSNGEDYYGSQNRLDTIALPAGIIKSQSYSSPSTNRYPTPASYNQWEPGRLTTATTFDNFTGGYLQHCHILPHEDSGQAVIVKIIDNMERSWFSYTKEFAPGENIEMYRSSTFERSALSPVNPGVSQRIAFGDINKDGYVDVIVGEGDGGSDVIRVYSGRDMTLMTSFHAFNDDGSWNHGVNLDVADVTGDGLNDICIGAGKGGGNLLNVFTAFQNKDSNGNILGIKFQSAGSLTAFDSQPDWADTNETRFTLGDFDADNFTDFAFLGSESAGNAIEVRSSRDGVVLSLFKSGLSGEIGLSSGFSSFHNLGLETLYMYQKYASTALVQSATLRAGMYVANSDMSNNPYYDPAKYYGYVKADQQVLLTKPVDILTGVKGFDWLVADRFSANDLPYNASSGSAQDPLTDYVNPLEIDATFSGFWANPVLVTSRGDTPTDLDYTRNILSYTSQSTLDRLPGASSDAAYVNAARDVIGQFVSILQRLPSPAELHRLANRIALDGKTINYISQVLTYTGNYSTSNTAN